MWAHYFFSFFWVFFCIVCLFSCAYFWLHSYCCCLSSPLLLIIFIIYRHLCYLSSPLLLIDVFVAQIHPTICHHCCCSSLPYSSSPYGCCHLCCSSSPEMLLNIVFLFIVTLLLVVTHTFKLGINTISTYCLVIHHHLVAHFTSPFFVVMILHPHLQCACYLQL